MGKKTELLENLKSTVVVYTSFAISPTSCHFLIVLSTPADSNAPFSLNRTRPPSCSMANQPIKHRAGY